MALKIGMLFPGYASQFVGMAKELYDSSRVVQEYFEEASNCLGINFVKLCFASSDSELSRIIHTYSSLFLVSSAIAALLKEHGITPYKVAGYNIGEYAALCSIGSLSLPDGLYFLSKFAALYEEELDNLNVRAINVAGLTLKSLQEQLQIVDQENLLVAISAYQTYKLHTITGLRNIMDDIEICLLKIKNVEVYDLPLGVGLYSPFVRGITAGLKMYSQKIDINTSKAFFISSIDGKPISEGAIIKEKLVQQIYSPILWKNVMKNMQDCDIFIHIGPGHALSNITDFFYAGKPSFVINRPVDIEKLLHKLE